MSNINVVIADDNERIRQNLQEIVSRECDMTLVGSASDGMDALSMIRTSHPDVVLLDIIMPKMDGLGVLEEVKKDENLLKKPAFIILTAMGQEEVMEEALGLGANYVLLKPFDSNALVKKIRQIKNGKIAANRKDFITLKEKTEEKVIQPKEDAERTTMTSTYSTSKRKSAVSDEERDVDEYNRRYTSVDVEEPYDEDSDGEVLAEYNDDMDNEKTVASDSKKERRSDTEYTERIIRYHSPSKITIAGADQVDLYLSDGYYAYGYDTDYSNGSTNVSVNVNIGNGWGGYYDPWYSGWYGGWYGGWYDPWIYSPARYWGYGPSFGFGWGWGGFYVGYWGPSWGWGPSYWGPGYWGGGYWGHHHHHYVSPYRHYSAGLRTTGAGGRSSGYRSSGSRSSMASSGTRSASSLRSSGSRSSSSLRSSGTRSSASSLRSSSGTGVNSSRSSRSAVTNRNRVSSGRSRTDINASSSRTRISRENSIGTNSTRSSSRQYTGTSRSNISTRSYDSGSQMRNTYTPSRSSGNRSSISTYSGGGSRSSGGSYSGGGRSSGGRSSGGRSR